MNNSYQKANKLNQLPIYTKESFHLQHKKQNYWRFIDYKIARIEHNNYDQMRNYFKRLLSKYEGKQISEFRYKLVNNSKFKHNKFFRRWTLDFLRDLEKGFESTYPRFNYKVENNIIVRISYPSCRWRPTICKELPRYEFIHKGEHLILKNGFYYKYSLYFSHEVSVPTRKRLGKLGIWYECFDKITRPHDRQLSKKDLKYFELTNVNGH